MCVWSNNPFGFGSKEPTASYTPCEPAPKDSWRRYAPSSAVPKARGAICARSLTSELVDSASLDYHFFINGEARYTRLAQQFPERAKEVSSADSGASGSDSPPDCHSIPSVSLRYFAKAEETAKAKYERLKKLVEFYNV